RPATECGTTKPASQRPATEIGEQRPLDMTTLQRRTLQQRYEAEFAGSRRLFERARTVFPDGVTHDSRRLGPFPIYVTRSLGSRKWDVDGHELIDFWNGHGALLLGHSLPEIVAAVQQQVAKGTHYGACHELEIEWGEWVKRLVPSAERV